MNIPVLYEDSVLMVVDKPAGVTVNRADTTVNTTTVQDIIEEQWGSAFAKRSQEYLSLHRGLVQKDQWDPTVDFYARCGIVHRLDKETSGALIIAKTPEAFADLQSQFKERIVKKTYIALCHGKISPPMGEINVPVGRLPWNRNRFGILPGGRPAVTEYTVIDYFFDKPHHEILSYLKLNPLTGRTHQIRVHLQYVGHPIFSDFLYAGRKSQRIDRKRFQRVFLHAQKISFLHPVTHVSLVVESPVPEDITAFLKTVRKMDEKD